MTDTKKLRAALVERQISQTAVARELNLALSTLQYKLNNRTEFKASEIYKIKEMLQLTAEQTEDIFFTRPR